MGNSPAGNGTAADITIPFALARKEFGKAPLVDKESSETT
jgi:hypothetical protein